MKEYFTNLKHDGVIYDIYEVGRTRYVNGIVQRKLHVYASTFLKPRTLWVVDVPVLNPASDVRHFNFFTCSYKKSCDIAMRFCKHRHSYSYLAKQCRRYLSSLSIAVRLLFSYAYTEYLMHSC